MRLSGRHFWVVHLVTIAICAFFAARATGQLLAGLLGGEPPAARFAQPRILQSTADNSSPRATTTIVSRNIFCSSCEPVAPSDSGDQPGNAANEAPVKTSLQYRLVATMVSDDDPDASVAFIVNTSNNQTGIYRVGAKLAERVKIIEVGSRQVLLLNGGRREFMTMGDADKYTPSAQTQTQAQASNFPRPEPEEGLESLANGMGQVGDRKYWVERSVLSRLLADSKPFAGVRALPHMVNGQPNGFAVYAGVGSIPSLLGLFSGDVIQAVNGRPLTNPENAREVLQSMRGASRLTLRFVRKGVELTHDYEIR